MRIGNNARPPDRPLRIRWSGNPPASTRRRDRFGSTLLCWLPASSGSFFAIRPRCQVPVRFSFLTESQFLKQVTHFLPPDVRRVRSSIFGVPGTIEPAGNLAPPRVLSGRPAPAFASIIPLSASSDPAAPQPQEEHRLEARSPENRQKWLVRENADDQPSDNK